MIQLTFNLQAELQAFQSNPHLCLTFSDRIQKRSKFIPSQYYQQCIFCWQMLATDAKRSDLYSSSFVPLFWMCYGFFFFSFNYFFDLQLGTLCSMVHGSTAVLPSAGFDPLSTMKVCLFLFQQDCNFLNLSEWVGSFN